MLRPMPRPPFYFDGFKFNYSPENDPHLPWVLWLCYKARRGDGAAAALLRQMLVNQGGTLHDETGRQYWPPTDADPVVEIGTVAIPVDGRFLLIFTGFTQEAVTELIDGFTAWLESDQRIGFIAINNAGGQVRLVRAGDPALNGLQPARIDHGRFIGEDCRLCGEPITEAQLGDVVCIGYSGDGGLDDVPAHSDCWVANIQIGDWGFVYEGRRRGRFD